MQVLAIYGALGYILGVANGGTNRTKVPVRITNLWNRGFEADSRRTIAWFSKGLYQRKERKCLQRDLFELALRTLALFAVEVVFRNRN